MNDLFEEVMLAAREDELEKLANVPAIVQKGGGGWLGKAMLRKRNEGRLAAKRIARLRDAPRASDLPGAVYGRQYPRSPATDDLLKLGFFWRKKKKKAPSFNDHANAINNNVDALNVRMAKNARKLHSLPLNQLNDKQWQGAYKQSLADLKLTNPVPQGATFEKMSFEKTALKSSTIKSAYKAAKVRLAALRGSSPEVRIEKRRLKRKLATFQIELKKRGIDVSGGSRKLPPPRLGRSTWSAGSSGGAGHGTSGFMGGSGRSTPGLSPSKGVSQGYGQPSRY